MTINEFVSVLSIICNMHSLADYDRNKECVDYYNQCVVKYGEDKLDRKQLEICIKNYKEKK